MARTHALMESLSVNLGEFLHSIDSDLTRPQKKFLRDGLIGLLRAGRPVVCRMTSLPVESPDDARCVLRYYARRWECEEGIRFLKSDVKLKRIRTFNWTAIRRLILLAVLVMIYLTWLLERHADLAERLIARGEPLPDKPDLLLCCTVC